jgi:phosphatidylglycerol:prolipoprotein diacylglycerol transferase
LRFPSQILEALLEGIVLFAILWKMRNMKLRPGILLAVYLMGYGVFRIFAEYFRQPDPQIGFLFGFFTVGQVLSVAMIIIGVILFSKSKKGAIMV